MITYIRDISTYVYVYVERVRGTVGRKMQMCSLPMKRDRQMNASLRRELVNPIRRCDLMPKVRDCNALISDVAFCAVVRRRFVEVFVDAAYITLSASPSFIPLPSSSPPPPDAADAKRIIPG